MGPLEEQRLLQTATVQTRGVCLSFVAAWLYRGDLPNALRATSGLITRGLLARSRYLIRPCPMFSEPLLGNARGTPLGDVGKAAYRNRRRWRSSPLRPAHALIATARAGNLFGVRRCGHLARPGQASHDLALAELFAHVVAHDPLACHWRGEDWVVQNVSGIQAEGDKLPDAFLLSGTHVLRVIELAGADYDKARLLNFVRWAEAKNYEFQVF